MFKKALAVLLTVSLVAGLTGCGKKSETVETQGDTGRYVEQEIALPEGVDSTGVFQIGKMDDALYLYTSRADAGKIGLESYLYEEGKFVEATPAWMENLSFDEEQMTYYTAKKVIEKVNGKSYFFCALVEDENWIGHLYCSSNGEAAEEITPPDWLVENEEYHFYEYPNDIVIMDDGTIVAYFAYMIRIYDGETREKIKEFQLASQYAEELYPTEDGYCLILKNNNYEFGGIDFYKSNGDSPQTTISCSQTIGASNYMDILSDGSLVVTGETGIMKKEAGSETWTQMVNGIFTSFAIKSMWCTGMTALDSDVYYALFTDDSHEVQLMEYSFDPTVANKPDTTLTVYSVYYNPAIKQAAAMYTKENPSVVVEVETVIPGGEEETADMNAVLQNLNTKLIAGEGADILVLDGLDTSSFTEKGMLADISGLITPMAEDGTILKNITDCYTNEDGTVYMIPLKFSMNILIGNKIDADKASTMEGLAEELSKQSEPILGPMTAQDLADTFVPYMVEDIVDGKELNKEALTEQLGYLKTIADNGGVIEAYPDEGRKWNIWDIASDGGAAFENAAGFLDAMFPMAAVKLVNGTFTSFENSFKPIGQIGINKSCKEQDIAQDFLKYALSFEMQDGDFYDGFPINVQALENQITKDRTDYGAYTDIEVAGGQYVEFVIGVISPENSQKLVDLCKKVDKKIVEDPKIEEVITQVLPSYVNSYSLNDTVNQIEKGLNMYLAE